VLFRIDEPSESAPSVGPGLPLYVPKAVAEEALSTVSGLPLDAHDNLSQHSNPDIAGVMLSASIQGNDFRVSGYLYDWSQSDKVAKIAANKEQLGMSMNANAIGHEAEVDGRKVFWVDKLELLGANILFSEKATYRQTRLLSAGGVDDTPPSPEGLSGTDIPAAPIAAASGDNPTPSQGEDDMTVDPEVKQQISDLTKTVGDLAGMVKEIMPAVQSVQAQVADIQKEREDNKAAIAAQAQQQQQQEQQQQFMSSLQTAIKDAVSTEVSAAVAKAVNPSGQPPRKTVSLAAQSNGNGGAVDQAQIQVLLQLASLEGELAALRKSPGVDGFEEIKLVDKIAQFKREYQLA
jgi:Sec-independent protein translocase protein TatA